MAARRARCARLIQVTEYEAADRLMRLRFGNTRYIQWLRAESQRMGQSGIRAEVLPDVKTGMVALFRVH